MSVHDVSHGRPGGNPGRGQGIGRQILQSIDFNQLLDMGNNQIAQFDPFQLNAQQLGIFTTDTNTTNDADFLTSLVGPTIASAVRNNGDGDYMDQVNYNIAFSHDQLDSSADTTDGSFMGTLIGGLGLERFFREGVYGDGLPLDAAAEISRNLYGENPLGEMQSQVPQAIQASFIAALIQNEGDDTSDDAILESFAQNVTTTLQMYSDGLRSSFQNMADDAVENLNWPQRFVSAGTGGLAFGTLDDFTRQINGGFTD